MSDKTKIEWADATVNAINGCSVHSPGCTNCYAMKQAHRFPVRRGLTVPSKGGMVWTGEVRLSETALLQPLRWKRPREIFWNAHGDTFHKDVPIEWIDRLFAVAALTPQHKHMILTKRSDLMRDYFSATDLDARFQNVVDYEFLDLSCQRGPNAYDPWIHADWPFDNVWLGVSAEDRARKGRIEDLRNTPAAKRFLSFEPLLEDLGELDLTGIDWVIVGGESGHKARPMHPDWVRSIRDQCAAAGVPFLFKQWGEWFPYGEIDADGNQNSRTRGEKPGLWHEWPSGDGFSVRIGKKQSGNHLDGVQHLEIPG